ncbi:PREDICTED: von Willebrand factor D and EGF domain-containing protein-like [Rhagoletis zephyria]|uniref:von Willebrand factor D and EGF domain-containing protein-like n=1 Tax=Rhagoletis zephyria TaxID=28612 RepID=UPI00081179F3|nr:PREDICTED: von Willebrand factor D and EGF domain-containing protein-like [Rhagoletis zephyria]
MNSLKLFNLAILLAVFIKPSQCKTILCKTLEVRGKLQEICQAICDENCAYGVCDYKPKRCICNKGYHPENNKCQPDCVKGCPANATCVVGSNNCRCNVGYEEDASGQCVPICSEKCNENSFCAAPNTCHCMPGYEQTTNGCQPICSEGCEAHAHCTAPNVCTCDAGYEAITNTSEKCQPICDVARCGNATTCLQPGVCECVAGYTRRNDSIDCLPVCPGGCGPHGICVAPAHCACVAGYVRHDEACRPKCPRACGLNAYCSQPEVCQCIEGFENRAIGDLEQSCQPICVNDCPLHAYCAAPNQCHCIAGYSLIDHTCVAHCTDTCGKHSSCIAPDTCRCNVGFLEQHGECVSSAQLQKCVKEMRVLFISMHVPCVTNSFVMNLFYGALIGLILVCGLITYKGLQHLRQKVPTRDGNYTQSPPNYVITYQPRGGENAEAVIEAECDMASASYSQPPVYNTLTQKC